MNSVPPEGTPPSAVGAWLRRWALPLVLMVLTFLSMLHVGSSMANGKTLWSGASFAVPLMAILLAHEFGHYIAGRIHGVPISPPYFIPMPGFLLGTMGAVIRMSGTIKKRNALLDVGASGPLAGLAIALPVLAYGLATSPIEAIPASGNFIIEGRSVLYLSLLAVLKGPIPAGHDVFLNPTAFAGWAGLLVTMINLLPVGQLDGGHVAYAVLGTKQDRISERIRRWLPVLAVFIGAIYAARAYLDKLPLEKVGAEALAGMHWLVWAGLLWVMKRFSGAAHPPTEDHELSPIRRRIAYGTLALFVLLFMPSWVRPG